MKPCSSAAGRSGIAGLLVALVFVTLVFVTVAVPAGAYSIDPIGVSGGNPGGQTLYQVSGLVQGDVFDVNWTLDGSGLYGGDFPDLSATATITVTSLSTTTLVLDITLSNTTTPFAGPPELLAPITVFGLAVEGVDLGNGGNGLTSAGSYLDFYDEGNISGGLRVDVCASTNDRCNRGNPGDGIQIGDSDSFQFTLQSPDEKFDPNNLILSHFGTKWQTNYDDIVTDVSDNSSFELPGEPVPEPSTASLLLLGLIGLGAVRRLRL